MNPLVITILLGTGLLALLPTRRLSQRSSEGWLVALYYLALWALLLLVIAVPPLRRLAIPVLLLLAIAPWLSLPEGIESVRRRLAGRRPPPRNVTPPSEQGPVGR